MRMRGLIVCAAAGCTLLATPSAADVSEGALVNAMRAIGASWMRVASTGEPFVTNCPKGGFAALRLSPGSQVSFDLRKTGSLMNPYVGVVFIKGEFQSNASHEDGSCHRSLEAAEASKAFWGNNWTYAFQLTYQVNGTALSLVNADGPFMTNGGNALVRINAASSSDWFRTMSVSLQ